MSLRIRLVLWLGCVLAVTLALGCALAGWRAGASVRAEMQSALAAGQQSAANSIEEINGSADPLREVRHLAATFDGNRHLRTILQNDRGEVIVASAPQPPAQPIPAWFLRLLGPRLKPVVLAVPETGTLLTLEADPTNEVGEVWDQATDAVRTLALFFVLAVLLISWTVGRALTPLARLSAAFGQIGAGDYAARIDPAGPPELKRLATGFNRMAEQLGEAEAQNRALREQLLTLQEEERAELARDLHDEIGPFLFAAAIDAAGIPPLLEAGKPAEAAERADAIRDSVAHMQRQIRSILGRLRPLSFGSYGMAEAIDTIVAFWRSRHPGIDFVLDIAGEDAAMDEAVRATACRVVQESVCNAVRHGDPGRIGISVTRDATDLVVRVDDDGAGPGTQGVTPGFGLAGMRERVSALAGTLAISALAGGRGLAVTARLPCEAAA
jgi:two-component system sensor histidine kinase UhpB